MNVPQNVDHWLGNGPNGPFRLVGGDTLPPELEALAPESWKSPAKSAPIASPAPASGDKS
jgi:hypothetical protein